MISKSRLGAVDNLLTSSVLHKGPSGAGLKRHKINFNQALCEIFSTPFVLPNIPSFVKFWCIVGRNKATTSIVEIVDGCACFLFMNTALAVNNQLMQWFSNFL